MLSPLMRTLAPVGSELMVTVCMRGPKSEQPVMERAIAEAAVFWMIDLKRESPSGRFVLVTR